MGLVGLSEGVDGIFRTRERDERNTARESVDGIIWTCRRDEMNTAREMCQKASTESFGRCGRDESNIPHLVQHNEYRHAIDPTTRPV